MLILSLFWIQTVELQNRWGRDILHWGVFFKRSVTIPIVRIQNINLSEGPVNRKFNLADVKIGTAGGSYKIPNLDKEEVEKIREFLRIKINENVREGL